MIMYKNTSDMSCYLHHMYPLRTNSAKADFAEWVPFETAAVIAEHTRWTFQHIEVGNTFEIDEEV